MCSFSASQPTRSIHPQKSELKVVRKYGGKVYPRDKLPRGFALKPGFMGDPFLSYRDKTVFRVLWTKEKGKWINLTHGSYSRHNRTPKAEWKDWTKTLPWHQPKWKITPKQSGTLADYYLKKCAEVGHPYNMQEFEKFLSPKKGFRQTKREITRFLEKKKPKLPRIRMVPNKQYNQVSRDWEQFIGIPKPYAKFRREAEKKGYPRDYAHRYAVLHSYNEMKEELKGRIPKPKSRTKQPKRTKPKKPYLVIYPSNGQQATDGKTFTSKKAAEKHRRKLARIHGKAEITTYEGVTWPKMSIFHQQQPKEPSALIEFRQIQAPSPPTLKKIETMTQTTIRKLKDKQLIRRYGQLKAARWGWLQGILPGSYYNRLIDPGGATGKVPKDVFLFTNLEPTIKEFGHEIAKRQLEGKYLITIANPRRSEPPKSRKKRKPKQRPRTGTLLDYLLG